MLTRVKVQFDMNWALEYRRVNTDVWISGHTEQMSSTSVLFRAAECVEPESRIEMVFRMPVADPCDLICTGTIQRVDLPSKTGSLPAITASIEDYSFVRRGENAKQRSASSS
jgi:hypothetical protein